MGTTYLAANPIFHARTKHIEIDFHFVQEMVAMKQLHIRDLSSKDQIADALTKALSSTRFHHLRDKLAVKAFPPALEGR